MKIKKGVKAQLTECTWVYWLLFDVASTAIRISQSPLSLLSMVSFQCDLLTSCVYCLTKPPILRDTRPMKTHNLIWLKYLCHRVLYRRSFQDYVGGETDDGWLWCRNLGLVRRSIWGRTYLLHKALLRIDWKIVPLLWVLLSTGWFDRRF